MVERQMDLLRGIKPDKIMGKTDESRWGESLLGEPTDY